MTESARFALKVGRALILAFVVTALVGIGSGVSAATGDQHPAGPADGAIADLDDPMDELNETTNETTDELDDTTDDLDETTNETTDELDDTTDDLEETGESLQETTSSGDIGVETDGIDSTLDLDATVDGELTDDLNGTLLESGASTTTGLGVSVESGGSDDASGSDSSGTGSSDGAAGTDSTPDEPGPNDAVDAGLVGVLGGLALLGQSAAGGAGATGAAGGTAAGSSTILSRFGRHLPRLAGTLSSILGKLPLSLLRYSRYDDSDPLEHETRRDIYEAIEADPGLYLSALEEHEDVSLSTIRHHLSVLEDEGLLETEKQNGKRRYYPAHTEDVELAAAMDEPAKARVLELLAETGDAHNGRIADALDLDPSTVSHHLSSLEDDGLIERRRDGRAIVNSLAPAVEAAFAPGTDSAESPDADATERVLTYGDD